MKRKPPQNRFVICLRNTGHPASLQLQKVYRVLPDSQAESDGDLRVIDESGEDYLFPREYFAFVELPPTAWRTLKRSLKAVEHVSA